MTDGTPFHLAINVDNQSADLHAGFTPNLAAFVPAHVSMTIGGTVTTPTNGVISFSDDVFGLDGIQFKGDVLYQGITQEFLAVARITGSSFALDDGTAADAPPQFATKNPLQFSGSGVVGHLLNHPKS